MKNKVLCRFISVICVLIVLLSYSCTAYAQDNKMITETDISMVDIDENYYITSIDEGYEEITNSSLNLEEYSIDIEEVIANSVDVKRVSSSSYSGSFTSDKYNAGIPGYKFQIKFDWETGVESGNLVFRSIKNYKVITYTNYLVLVMAWESYTYRLTKASYTYNSGRNIVMCFANYAFDVRDKTTHNNVTLYGNNTKSFSLSSLL